MSIMRIWRTLGVATLGAMVAHAMLQIKAFSAFDAGLIASFFLLVLSMWCKALYTHRAYVAALACYPPAVLLAYSWHRHYKSTALYGLILLATLSLVFARVFLIKAGGPVISRKEQP